MSTMIKTLAGLADKVMVKVEVIIKVKVYFKAKVFIEVMVNNRVVSRSKSRRNSSSILARGIY